MAMAVSFLSVPFIIQVCQCLRSRPGGLAFIVDKRLISLNATPAFPLSYQFSCDPFIALNLFISSRPLHIILLALLGSRCLFLRHCFCPPSRPPVAIFHSSFPESDTSSDSVAASVGIRKAFSFWSVSSSPSYLFQRDRSTQFCTQLQTLSSLRSS